MLFWCRLHISGAFSAHYSTLISMNFEKYSLVLQQLSVAWCIWLKIIAIDSTVEHSIVAFLLQIAYIRLITTYLSCQIYLLFYYQWHITTKPLSKAKIDGRIKLVHMKAEILIPFTFLVIYTLKFYSKII